MFLKKILTEFGRVVFLALVVLALVFANLVVNSSRETEPVLSRVATGLTAIVLLPAVIHTLLANRVARLSLVATVAVLAVNICLLCAVRFF